MAKLKAELNELSNSLKTTLEARGSLEEKLRQVTKEVYKAKKEADVWKAEAEARKNIPIIMEGEAAKREKALSIELEKCQSFILRISKNFFYQGRRHVAFFHGVPWRMTVMT